LASGTMSMVAAGAYIRRLRNKLGMSQEDIARALETSQKQVSRWENGEHQPLGAKLNALVALVQGNMSDIMALLSNPSATAEDGERLADTWLNSHLNDQQAIARFFTRQFPCTVCGETTWRVGATITTAIIDPITHEPKILTGPFRVMLQIVCRTCGHVLLFDTGEIPTPESTGGGDSPESVQSPSS
jgi:transcriptional regulator with XRE-family HTH domain